MRLKNLDLIGAIYFAALSVGWAQLPSRPLIIGIILAVPLVFVLPGYTLTQVLFRKRAPDQSSDPSSNLIRQPGLKIGQPVSAVDHIIFSLGLSMAIDVLMGFILNVFPAGLQLRSWAFSLGLTTTILALLAAYLRRRELVKVARIPRFRITISECLLLGLAILVAVLAVWFSANIPPQPQPSFTQFWMLPSKQANNSCIVSIGVQSFETTSVSYRVVVTVDGAQADTWPSIVLAPQEKWVQSVPVTPDTASTMSIEAQLYRADKPNIAYRNVHLIFHISTGSKKCGSLAS